VSRYGQPIAECLKRRRMEGLFTTVRPRQHVRIDRYEEIRLVTAVDVRGEEHHGRARRERGPA
jgi:hypothetical protein